MYNGIGEKMKKVFVYLAFSFGVVGLLCFASSLLFSNSDTQAQVFSEEEIISAAKNASALYISNTSKAGMTVSSFDDTIILVEKAGKYYSFKYTNGILEAGDVYEHIPKTINGLVIDKNVKHLNNIPSNIYIFIPKC
jgi:hypothetical protein